MRTHWATWINFLHRRGWANFATWLLEAGAPLRIVGAQLLYLGQPLFSAKSAGGISALANLLEEEDETQAFVALLKGPAQ